MKKKIYYFLIIIGSLLIAIHQGVNDIEINTMNVSLILLGLMLIAIGNYELGTLEK